MDEEKAIKQPLLSDDRDINDYDEKGGRNGSPDPVPAPIDVLRHPSSWRANVSRGTIVLITFWMAWWFTTRQMPTLMRMFHTNFDELRPYDSLLESHRTEQWDVDCDRIAFEEGAAYSPYSDWIPLTDASVSVTYDLTIAARDLKIFTRGPIVGNVTLTSGETKSDDVVEVEIEFKKPGCKKHKLNGHKKHKAHEDEEVSDLIPPTDLENTVLEDDDEEASLELDVTENKFCTRAWRSPLSGSGDKDENELDAPHSHYRPSHKPHRSPHHPPPPPKVKVCPLYTEEGHIKGLGIFAYRHERRGGHPHEPPPPPPPPGEYAEMDGFPVPPHPPAPPHPPTAPRPPKMPSWPHRSHKPHRPHRKWHPRPALAHITVRFPSPKTEEYIELPSFTTALAGFKHVVRDLAVSFGKLELVTVGRPIFVKHASATFLKVVAIKGAIFGRFSASKYLELFSLGKPIAASVDLYSGPHEGFFNAAVFNATVFKAHTANSWVAANISLHSTSDEPGHFPPSYYINTGSSGASHWHGHRHSGTFLKVARQPTNSSLVVDAHTRGAPIVVSVPAAFQGWFDLNSVFSKPSLAVNEETEDPTGEGRKRVVTLRKTWTRFGLAGTVKWVKDELISRVGGCAEHVDFAQGGVGVNEDGEKQAYGKIKLTSVGKPAKLALA